jgi:hypothetical protein
MPRRLMDGGACRSVMGGAPFAAQEEGGMTWQLKTLQLKSWTTWVRSITW